MMKTNEFFFFGGGKSIQTLGKRIKGCFIYFELIETVIGCLREKVELIVL